MSAATKPYEPSYTIAEFCEAERMTEPSYFKLRDLGLGPKEMRGPLSMVRIAHSARLEWQQRMQSASDHPAVQKTAKMLSARGRKAAAAAVASPNHISHRRRRTGVR